MIRCVLSCLVAAIFLLGGCMHSPPHGAESGVVHIENMNLWSSNGDIFRGSLNGVVLDDQHVLTSAHLFLSPPERGHPLRLNHEPIVYEIVLDGWSGKRIDLPPEGKGINDLSLIQSDFLILRVSELDLIETDAVPLDVGRIHEFRKATIVTLDRETLNPKLFPIAKVVISKDHKHVGFEQPTGWDDEELNINRSGSPLIGEYGDGTLVLVGIVSAFGEVQYVDNGIEEVRRNQLFFTPAYRIPWDQITD